MAASESKSKRRIQRFGWNPDIPDARDFLYSAPEAVLTQLPTKVDLRRQCGGNGHRL